MAQLIGSIVIMQLVKLIKRYRNKKKKNRIELENEGLDFVLINLSGHPLSKQAINEALSWGKCKIIEKKIPNIDLNNPSMYMDNVINFCGNIIKELIKKDYILNNLLLGKYIVVPPGMPSLAITFIAMFHGISGHFPKMTFTYKVDIGYNLIKPFDFQNLRLKYYNIQKFSEKNEKVIYEIPLINFSGHLLSAEAKFEVKNWGNYKIIENEIPTIDLSSSLIYMENICNFCANFVEKLNNNDWILNSLFLGTYIIIPAGMTSIAITLIIALHGITGHFPRMSFLYKKGEIFSLTKPFDFQDLRLNFRAIEEFAI